MKQKIAIVIGIVTLLAIGVVLTSAHGHFGQDRRDGRPGPPPPGGPERLEHMARMLNLTDEQKTQIKAIHEAEQAATEPNNKKFAELHQQLEEATANGQFDEAKVRAIANQQAQLTADSMVEHERAKAKIYNILTPEQRVKADELHKHMRHPGGPGGPGGPGAFRRPGPPPPPPAPGQQQ